MSVGSFRKKIKSKDFIFIVFNEDYLPKNEYHIGVYINAGAFWEPYAGYYVKARSVKNALLSTYNYFVNVIDCERGFRDLRKIKLNKINDIKKLFEEIKNMK